MKPFLIGRKSDCDVVIPDPSVSRHHAELVAASNAEYLLVDCESKFGTFVKRDGEWCRITTTQVQIDDQVRLGRHETSIRDLVASAAKRPHAADDGENRPGRMLIERNPETGEIIARRER